MPIDFKHHKIKKMFTTGNVVKSKIRTDEYPKFVMVLEDKNPSKNQFRGVVLFCKLEDEEESVGTFSSFFEEDLQGYEADNFNTPNWVLSSWEELKKFI